MTYEAEISTPVTGSGIEGDAWRPDVSAIVANGSLWNWSDRTAVEAVLQPIQPDAMNIYVRAESLVMDQFASNSDFYIHWLEAIPEDDIPVQEVSFGKAVEDFVLEQGATPEVVKAGQELVQAYEPIKQDIRNMNREAAFAAAEDATQLFEIEAILHASEQQILKIREQLPALEIEVRVMVNDIDYYGVEFIATLAEIETVKEKVAGYSERSRNKIQPVTTQVTEEKPQDSEPTPNEWGTLRSWCAQQGFSQAQINEAIGETPAGRKNSQVCDDLRAWIRDNGTVGEVP